ncbi:MAG: toll/interleukin-1 receptor domain-containing protein [Candidatus Cryptobacteroides sp.]
MAKNIFGQHAADRESNRQWDELIDNIIKGDVIPVIGPGFLAEDENDAGRCVNPHQVLVDMLSESYGIKSPHHSFSELLYDDAFPASQRKDIYDMLGEAFQSETETEKIFKPSWLLMKLIEVCRFRFVITTSFTPIVEYAMDKVWNEKVRVMKFSNNPSENDDLKTADELQIPTVYYMFGKVCRNAERYVVKDSDMLSFCRSWLSSAPKTLVNVLKHKYLLILGNNYSDWLCRFIWYSMKVELDSDPKGMIVDESANDNLLQFMKRIDAFTQTDPRAVIAKIEQMVRAKEQEKEKSRYRLPEMNADVFLSYSRRDEKVIRMLYDALTSRGLRVWYDKENLGLGDRFMEEIKQSIRKSRVFVPLLTHNMEEERNQSHPYRTEWKTAIEVASTYGRNYILPISEAGFDMYSSSIPNELQKHNSDSYNPEHPDFTVFADKVFNFLMTI